MLSEVFVFVFIYPIPSLAFLRHFCECYFRVRLAQAPYPDSMFYTHRHTHTHEHSLFLSLSIGQQMDHSLYRNNELTIVFPELRAQR